MAVNPVRRNSLIVNSIIDSESSQLWNPENENIQQGNQKIRKLSKRDYINISVLCFDTVCHGLSFALISSFYPITALKKGLTMSDVGIIFAALPMATVIFSLIVSKYVNKIGTKRMLMASLFVMPISLLAFSFVMKLPNKSSFYALSFISRVFQGVAFVCGQISAFSIVTIEYNNLVSTIIGLLEMSISIGIACGPALGGFLHDAFGFEAPFYVLMGIFALFFVFTLIFVKPPSVLIDVTDTTDTTNGQNLFKIPMNFKTFKTVPILLAPMIMSTLAFVGFTYVDVSLAPFMHDNFHLSPSYIGLNLLVASAVYSIFAPVIGKFVDKKGYHSLVMLLGVFITFPCLVFIGPVPFLKLGQHLWSSILCLVILMVGYGFIYIPSLGLSFRIAQLYNIDDSDSAQSFLTSTFVLFTNIGNLIGPLIGGFLMNTFGFGLTCGILGASNLLIGVIMCVALYLVFRKH